MFIGNDYGVAQNELEPDENLLWTGTPDARRAMISSFAMWLLAVPWTAFSLNSMWSASGMGRVAWPPSGLPPNFGFVLFNVPFIFIGFAMLLTPLWTFRQTKRTTYAITDRRVLIIETGKTKTVRSWSGKDIGEIKPVEREGGSGHLAFAPRVSTDSEGSKQTTETKFIDIPDVRSVDNLLRATFKRD